MLTLCALFPYIAPLVYYMCILEFFWSCKIRCQTVQISYTFTPRMNQSSALVVSSSRIKLHPILGRSKLFNLCL